MLKTLSKITSNECDSLQHIYNDKLQNENFEYGYPQSIALLQVHLKL